MRRRLRYRIRGRTLTQRVRALESAVGTHIPTTGRAAPPRRRHYLGLALLVLGAFGAVYLLVSRPGTEVPLHERIVGFATQVVPKGEFRSFSVTARVEVESCDDPVDVSILVEGTSQFWSDWSRRLPNPTSVGLAVLDTDLLRDEKDEHPPALRILRAGDALDPTVTSGAPEGSPYAREGEFRPTRGGWLTYTEGRQEGPGGFVTLGSIRNWGRSWAPLVTTFEADWLERRGFRSCYLRLPTLVGSQTIRPVDVVEDALDLDEDPEAVSSPRIAASVGEVEIVSDLDVSLEKSVPRPTYWEARYATWRCTPLAGGGQTISPRGQYAAPSARDRYGQQRRNAGCNALVVLDESGREVLSALGLILLGGAISLGLQYVIEVGFTRRAG